MNRHISTSGGAYIGKNVRMNGGTFVGRDLTILQQEVQFSELDRMAEERPRDALRSYLALRDDANGRSRYFRARMDSLQQHLEEQMPRLIFDLGEMVQTNQQKVALSLMELLRRFYKASVQPKDNNPPDEPSWQEVFELTTCLLKDNPDCKEDAPQLAKHFRGEETQSIFDCISTTFIFECIKKIFKAYQQDAVPLLDYLIPCALNLKEKKDLQDKLVADDGLRRSVPAVGRLKPESYPLYTPFRTAGKPSPAQIADWKQANTPDFYPFLLECAPSAEIIAFPKHWEELCAFSETGGILSDSMDDLRILSSALRAEWNTRQPKLWVVRVRSFAPAWQALLNALTDAWTKFLAYNPQAVHHLSECERLRLALLIQWRYPNLSTFGRELALLNWDETNQQALIRTLNRLLKNATQPELLTLKFLDDFLALRPAGKEESIFLIESLEAPTPERDALLEELIRTAQDHRLYFKVLVRERLPLTTIPSTRLYWETEKLQSYLNDRVQRAEAPGDFNSFFDPPVREGDKRLAHLADGSLARLLRLGHRLVQHAVQAGHEMLQPADLDWLENQYTDRDPLREGGAL